MTSLSDTARAFYDSRYSKFLVDYVHGNTRTEAAIGFVTGRIPAGARRVLDIGCGIGWTSSEIKRRHPQADVRGVDLSPALIDAARALFQGPGLDFDYLDVTNWNLSLHDVDAVVLVDVYEHIPKEARAQVNSRIANLLSDSGFIVLTFPSMFHQAHLRAHEPTGLQPVDEDVALADVLALAAQASAHVTAYNHVSVWHSNDYVYSVIERRPEYVRVRDDGSRRARVGLTESRSQRRQRVRERMHLDVAPDGVLTSVQPRRGLHLLSRSADDRD